MQYPPQYITVILPAILTVIGNIIFYLLIKGRIDNSIEKHKIAYSGIFKERIDIYKQCFSMIFDLKSLLNKYQYVGNMESTEKIKQNFSNFIRFYEINRPFLSEAIINDFSKINAEFQIVFEAIYRYHNEVDNQSNLASYNIYIEAINKLRDKIFFKSLENNIIKEMKKDLRIDS